MTPVAQPRSASSIFYYFFFSFRSVWVVTQTTVSAFGIYLHTVTPLMAYLIIRAMPGRHLPQNKFNLLYDYIIAVRLFVVISTTKCPKIHKWRTFVELDFATAHHGMFVQCDEQEIASLCVCPLHTHCLAHTHQRLI